MTQNEDTVRELAYYKWEAAGRPEGRDVEFWQAAQDDVAATKTRTKTKRTTVKTKATRKQPLKKRPSVV